MIKIKPRYVECANDWISKKEGVIFVENEKDIDILFELLCRQDDYWEDYRHLIKVGPKEIDSELDLLSYCEYVGITDIYDINALKKSVDFRFTIFQDLGQFSQF